MGSFQRSPTWRHIEIYRVSLSEKVYFREKSSRLSLIFSVSFSEELAMKLQEYEQNVAEQAQTVLSE